MGIGCCSKCQEFFEIGEINGTANKPDKIIIKKMVKKVSFNDSNDSSVHKEKGTSNGFFGLFGNDKEKKGILKPPSPKNKDDNKNNLIKNNKFPSVEDIQKSNLYKNEQNDPTINNNDLTNKKEIYNIDINTNSNTQEIENKIEVNINNIKEEDKKENNEENKENENNEQKEENNQEENKVKGEIPKNSVDINIINKDEYINIIQEIQDSNEHVIKSDTNINKEENKEEEIGQMVKSSEVIVEPNPSLNEEVKLKSQNNINVFAQMKSDIERKKIIIENPNPINENILENNINISENPEENNNNSNNNENNIEGNIPNGIENNQINNEQIKVDINENEDKKEDNKDEVKQENDENKINIENNEEIKENNDLNKNNNENREENKDIQECEDDRETVNKDNNNIALDTNSNEENQEKKDYKIIDEE